jgi:hypothetical protein
MYAEVAPLALKYEAVLLAGIEAVDVRRLEQWLRRLQRTAAALTDGGTGQAR